MLTVSICLKTSGYGTDKAIRRNNHRQGCILAWVWIVDTKAVKLKWDRFQ
jgi:hypothetical protein